MFIRTVSLRKKHYCINHSVAIHIQCEPNTTEQKSLKLVALSNVPGVKSLPLCYFNIDKCFIKTNESYKLVQDHLFSGASLNN